MSSIYGSFDTLTPAQAAAWTPPPMAEGHRGRYLWTDAFGVLNLLTLGALTTRHALYAILAARLVTAVHDVLGRTRDGTRRLPGASDAHPLAGGLRIGKEVEEDDPGGDGDGQYHHYLTLWMFAPNRLSRATGERRHNDLAIELARAIHPKFVRDRDAVRPRMCWKMSVDLGRPLVRSEGNLDPIDGYHTWGGPDQVMLAREIDEHRRILETKWRRYASDDPLDLGMTLWTAHWFDGREQWATELSRRAAMCLRALREEEGYFDAPTRYRLAFRELGTCLGVRCLVAKLDGADGSAAAEKAHWEEFVEKVLATWASSVEGDPQLVPEKLQPITMVMFAAALFPGAFVKGFFGEEV
ncbi:hypothetical protein C8Q78DRAFT_1065189 [Trametes maxima]|nr:hypothetical protein C8Q78DRAFT_1065189 [Trametes maxima]